MESSENGIEKDRGAAARRRPGEALPRRRLRESGRKNFEFSQAIYAFHTGKIETRPLNLLRLE